MSAPDESIRLSLQVFRNDAPHLYALLSKLPASRHRRRAILLDALQRGLSARLDGEVVLSVPHAVPVGGLASEALPDDASAPIMDMDDLADVFGSQFRP